MLHGKGHSVTEDTSALQVWKRDIISAAGDTLLRCDRLGKVAWEW